MAKQSDFQLGAILLGVAGVLLFSAKAVLVKMAYQYDVDAISLLFFRMLFALPFYVLILLFTAKRFPKKVKRSDYLWLAFFSFLGYYMSSLLDFLGLQYIKASLERLVLFVYPTLIILISRIFFGIKVSRWQVAAIAIAYLGILITFWSEMSLNPSRQLFVGAGFVFLAAITFASYLVGSGWLIPKFGSIRFTNYAMILACLFVVVHTGLYNGFNLWSFQSEVYWLGLAMAILATVLPSYLVSEAIKYLGATNFGIIASLGPISTIILANILLNETMTIIQLAGASLVIISVTLLAYKKRRERKRQAMAEPEAL